MPPLCKELAALSALLPSGTETRKRDGTVTRAFMASLKVRDVPECCPLWLLVVEATVQLRTGLVDEMFKGLCH